MNLLINSLKSLISLVIFIPARMLGSISKLILSQIYVVRSKVNLKLVILVSCFPFEVGLVKYMLG